jgi:hypothetical protein
MEAITCPHCQAVNAPDAQFCEACGKAVAASVGAGGPRIVQEGEYAATDAGAALQSDLLQKDLKKTTGALLAVAILQVVVGTFVVVVSSGREVLGTQAKAANPAVPALSVYTIGAIFFGLYFWARKSPYPAAIVGLVVFVTVHLLDALVDPAALLRGIVVKVIVIAVLVNAIKAGARHRELLRHLQVGRTASSPSAVGSS